MKPLKERIEKARICWINGRNAEESNKLELAYQLFTEAHDLIMDCAALHQQAHENLRRINWKMGNYRELVTDWLLHLFAPLGVFELVSYFSKTGAFGNLICKRNA